MNEKTMLTPAQEALQQALVALMLEKPFLKIGVKELCARAHVSRSTFYAYYGNTDELLEQVEDAHVAVIRTFNEPVADPDVEGVEHMRFYAKMLLYVTANEDDFRALLVTDPDARFSAKWKDAIKGHLRARRAAEGEPAVSALAQEAAASSVIASFAYMLERPDSVVPDDVYALIAGALAALDS